tara:strand:+ start:3482 stop:3679 length:198 start_codon:yes stop_codon:yes gene_type:complete
MDNEELKLYNHSGSEKTFLKKYISKESNDTEDKDIIIKKYRKKIIEQRHEIEKLNETIKGLKERK